MRANLTKDELQAVKDRMPKRERHIRETHVIDVRQLPLTDSFHKLEVRPEPGRAPECGIYLMRYEDGKGYGKPDEERKLTPEEVVEFIISVYHETVDRHVERVREGMAHDSVQNRLGVWALPVGCSSWDTRSRLHYYLSDGKSACGKHEVPHTHREMFTEKERQEALKDEHEHNIRVFTKTRVETIDGARVRVRVRTQGVCQACLKALGKKDKGTVERELLGMASNRLSRSHR